MKTSSPELRGKWGRDHGPAFPWTIVVTIGFSTTVMGQVYNPIAWATSNTSNVLKVAHQNLAAEKAPMAEITAHSPIPTQEPDLGE